MLASLLRVIQQLRALERCCQHQGVTPKLSAWFMLLPALIEAAPSRAYCCDRVRDSELPTDSRDLGRVPKASRQSRSASRALASEGSLRSAVRETRRVRAQRRAPGAQVSMASGYPRPLLCAASLSLAEQYATKHHK